ncbi:MAG TPA: hypothetical protein VFS88_09815 [Micavibrio sp.]|nr:hypothetical protein [Micavibrio sp.]
MSKAVIAAAAFATIVAGETLHAQTAEFPACADDHGARVTYMTDDQYQRQARGQIYTIMFAAARYMNADTAQEPVIGYSAPFIDSINQSAGRFVFLHECFHLSSGDARKAYLSIQGGGEKAKREMEDNADCSAATRMRDEFHASEEEMFSIAPMIDAVSSGRGAERMADIMACYRAP